MVRCEHELGKGKPDLCKSCSKTTHRLWSSRSSCGPGQLGIVFLTSCVRHFRVFNLTLLQKPFRKQWTCSIQSATGDVFDFYSFSSYSYCPQGCRQLALTAFRFFLRDFTSEVGTLGLQKKSSSQIKRGGKHCLNRRGISGRHLKAFELVSCLGKLHSKQPACVTILPVALTFPRLKSSSRRKHPSSQETLLETKDLKVSSKKNILVNDLKKGDS
ncbi:uncharacterized protein [Struthio camelus]|uniref:uncharacterized protein n=1 Tax=Struthio camelus TaxID=8801 RepID=UPI003604261D